MPFTIAWQSSNVPSIASVWTLSAPVREQDEKIRSCAAAKCLDRGPTGVPGRSHDDGGALASRREHLVHEPAEQLHSQILERERGPVKQFKDEIAHAELHEWSDRRMMKPAISLARHAGEIGVGDGIADKRPDDLHRDFGIRPAGKTGDGLGIEPRPSSGHVKAAVAGKPCQHRLSKTERRGLASGGKVMHAPRAPFRGQDRRCARRLRPGGHTR
jgi:hypothetical protein